MLRLNDKMTLSQLNQKWIDDCVTDGNPLARSTFNHHREAIQDLFGVVIDCERKYLPLLHQQPQRAG
jgi:hypothetical protein